MKDSNYFAGPVLDFVREAFGAEDDALRSARRRGEAAGLPAIEVSPEDGALLAFFVHLIRPLVVVEVGTLFGYSGIWLARALPAGGRLVTIEVEERHAEVARVNFAEAGVESRVSLLVGAAQDVLPTVPPPVDMVFIDADKGGYPHYLEWARGSLRPGGLVAADNAFAWGRLAEPADDPDAGALRRFSDELISDPAWQAAMVPTLNGLAVGVRTGR